MVGFSSLGNVLLSKGMKQIGDINDFSYPALATVCLKTFTNSTIWLGIFSLFVFFVSYLLALSWADFSYVQPASAIGYAIVAMLGSLLALLSWADVTVVVPATALSYVAGAFGARFLLHEQVAPLRWAGALLVCVGVALLSGS